MNSLFRKIKENINIDYGEESDDEETFQDMRVDKYVDLACEHMVECVFNHKFRMWEPIRKVETKHYIHISELTATQEVRPNRENTSYINRENKPYLNRENASHRENTSYMNRENKPYLNRENTSYMNRENKLTRDKLTRDKPQHNNYRNKSYQPK